MMFVVSMTMMWFVILSCIYGDWFTSFLCGLFVCLYGLFLLCDTQLVVGKGRHKLSLDDYVAGAMLIYTDIIMIFVYLLQILG